MDIDITVALIAAGASLIVSVVAMISAVVTSKHSARSAEALEALKHELTRRGVEQQLGDEHLSDCLEALQLLIGDIQRVKDELQLILSAIETSLPAKTAMVRISEARERLFQRYEEHMACLDDEEREASHKAKNLALHTERKVHEALQHKSYASRLGNEERSSLIDLRNRLTDCQNLLRDSRVGRILERTGASAGEGRV